MKRFYASTFTYTILAKKNDNLDVIYPYFRDDERGDKEMFLVSPQHGRSYMVGLKDCDRYVICKGGGLSYTTQNIMDTPEMEADIWGLLWYKDALRDFTLCNEVASIGEIKTNRMECVIELDLNLSIRADKKQKPVLLQYSVESPYRISDAAFMNKSIINKEVAKWEIFNQKSYKQKYLIAAEVLIRNLRILHDHKILHNAISTHNYTWALELLDFELACSPAYPYEQEDYKRHIPSLFAREIIQTYQIINEIAWLLREDLNYKMIESIFNRYKFYI